MKKSFAILFALVSLAVSTTAQTPVSISSLLNEMVDRSEKARFPSPEFTCRQFSSYDRTSVEPGKPGWFANWDRTQFLSVDRTNGRTEYVMMDIEGPGAIVRFWMTFAGKDCGLGTLRIYVDDMSTPVIEGSAFDVLSGDKVTAYPLAASVSELSPYENRGHNLYFPIPYAKRCKVTYQSENVYEDDFGAKHPERSECVYYNINYRTYAPTTAVVSYSAPEMAKNKKLIASTLDKLKNKDRGLKGVKLSTLALDAELAPGKSKSFDIAGPGAIRRLAMRIGAQDIPQSLRSLVVGIAFDGEQSVWIPAGDLFGVGPRRIYTNTWYTQASLDGLMEAFWVMPFEKSCKITLTNMGKEPLTLTDARAQYAPWKWDARSMHFGASWHQYNSIYTGGAKDMSGESDGLVDLNYVTLTGKGVYIGDGISLFNTTYGWWGEGDEKVFVDGEKFPSHIGTGTEDYYGYAWCRPEKFTDHPFIAQPCGDGSFAPAYSVNTRLRALDGIPFHKSIQFDMELWHWAKGYIDYAASTFWYVFPGGRSNIAPDIEGVQRKVAVRRSDLMPERVTVVLEGENMRLVSKDNGWFDYSCNNAHLLSGGMQMFWWGNAPGAKLTMAFDSDAPFKGTIRAKCTKNIYGGTVNIYLNGKLLISGLDLRSERLHTADVTLGTGEIKEGENTFVFEIAGDKAGDVGMDLFLLEK